MGETDSEEMTCEDVVKTIYISGSICFTASGARTARKVIFDKVLAIIFSRRNALSRGKKKEEKKVFGTK